MNRHERLLRTILRGRSDANIRFDDLRALMQHLGFEERVRASAITCIGKQALQRRCREGQPAT